MFTNLRLAVFNKKKFRKYLVILSYIALLFFIFNFILLIFYSVSFIKSGQSLLKASLQNKPEIVQSQWLVFQKSGLRLIKLPLLRSVDRKNREIFEKCLLLAPQLIGLNGQEKFYTVLLQNNKELRATGGFIGSYAHIRFQKGALVDYKIEDIYVPDGAIDWHIDAPEPIQKAFKQGTWRLPDSNWDSDFPSAVKTIDWFFDKAGVETGDGIIALNFEVLENVFKIIGEIYLPDYESSVSADSLYITTQDEVEKDFFPGSTKKKDFLQYLTKNLLIQSQFVNNRQVFDIADLVFQSAEQRNIQFYFKNPSLQELVSDLGWSGKLKWPQPAKDYILIVDTNLGANKANCCVDREVKQTINEKEDIYEVNLQIDYINKNLFKDPKPPEHWGGDYENYLRILLPEKAEIGEIKVENKTLTQKEIIIEKKEKQKLQSVGFFVNVPHKEQRQVKVNYTLAKEKDEQKYNLFIQKQSGISYWHTVEYSTEGDMETVKKWVDRDNKMEF